MIVAKLHISLYKYFNNGIKSHLELCPFVSEATKKKLESLRGTYPGWGKKSSWDDFGYWRALAKADGVIETNKGLQFKKPSMIAKSDAGPISDPNKADFLRSRAERGRIYKQPENMQLRHIARSKKKEFTVPPLVNKYRTRIATRIVDDIRTIYSPARSFKKARDTGLWYEVGDAKATQKTEQALPQNAQDIRSLMDNSDGYSEDPMKASIDQASFFIIDGVQNSQHLVGREGKRIVGRWVRKENLLLWEGQKKLGKRWLEISTKLFNSTRSETQIKNRWYSPSFAKFITDELGSESKFESLFWPEPHKRNADALEPQIPERSRYGIAVSSFQALKSGKNCLNAKFDRNTQIEIEHSEFAHSAGSNEN